MSLLIPLALAGGAAALFAVASPATPQDYSLDYGDGSQPDDSPLSYGSDDNVLTPDPSDANVRAYLRVLMAGESSANYGALVGGGTFTDLSHHPGWTNAAMTTKSAWSGWHDSHAAGAYQFQPGTFKEASDALGLHGDFGRASQDAAAIWDLKRRGAYDLVAAGNIEGAQVALADEWQSLGDRGIDWVRSTFINNGGLEA